jgi:DNA polymerase elongation subunit (family B)
MKNASSEPIRPEWYPRRPKSALSGVLLNIEYDGKEGLAKLKLYNPSSMKVYEWLDNSEHHPYCLTDYSRSEVEKIKDVIGHKGFLRIEEMTKFILLHDKEQKLVSIVASDPLAIGGRRDSIREKLGREHSWEADIRYVKCYTYDRALTPGLYYRIKEGNIQPVSQKFSAKDAAKIRKLFEPESKASKLVEEYLPLFLSPAAYLPRIALDIEVKSPHVDRIPDPVTAEHPVIAVAISDDTETGTVFILQQNQEAKQPQLPEGVTYQYFTEERQLLEAVFHILWRTPLLFTFNGDNFDLRYLSNRAKRLGITQSDNPIRLRQGLGSNFEAHLKYGVHVDLYRFFHNRSIQIYAFRNRYTEHRLEDICQALLGEGKRELPDIISRLPPDILADYCWQDARLTMKLTQFDNDLVLSLILLLMRVSHQGMHDLTRSAVSNWIRSLLYFAHRQNNYLIPRKEEIEALKGTATTEAVIKGRKYLGAIVVEPKTGLHFDVTVLDFASLYPSIMKAYNISYETVRCTHDECQSNKVPGTSHWICTKRTGLTSLIIGVIRDVRVGHFKPRSKDKTLSKAQQSWYSVVEQALKVFLNACLPFDEEVVVRTTEGQIQKRPIGSLQKDWRELEVLSVKQKHNNNSFGTPVFVPIQGFAMSGVSKTLDIRLADGRLLKCTPNHMIPRAVIQSGRESWREFDIEEVFAEDLKVGDEIFILNSIPLNSSPPKQLFIPDLIDHLPIYVGMEREIYKQFSYRRSQTTDNELIKIINSEFSYNKSQKIYRAKWNSLSEESRAVIRRHSCGLMRVKIGNWVGRWRDITLELTQEFFSLIGWFLAEGSVGVNRFTIAQRRDKNPENVLAIETLLNTLGWPFGYYNEKDFTINSNVLTAIMEKLCGRRAVDKHVPFELLNKERARLLLDSYFQGDGNLTNQGERRYSTISIQLARDLVSILGAIGRYASIHSKEGIYRVVETKGRSYKRKYRGLIEFNGTYPVRVKSIKASPDVKPVFDIETGNGWFVATNGIITHNSYGVVGAAHFPLYCAPAAESITAYGRYAITETIKQAESLGVTVLYGDTDSLFLAKPTKEQLRKLIDYSEQELRVELDVEKEYRYLALSSRKKNYLGVTKSGYVDIKGLTGKKRNTPLFLQRAFMQMVDILRQVQSPRDFDAAKERILRLAREHLTKLERREFPVEELAIRMQLTKSPESYVKTTPQHVKAARQLIEAGRDVSAGDIISFVKTVGGVKPVEHASIQDIDVAKYKELVKSTFEQVLDALGIEWIETIGIRRLDSFFG